MAAKRQTQPGGTRGTVFREVAALRLKDAETLLRAKRFQGSLYLAGYAIECLLKFGVTRRQGCVYLPAELETHDLDRLLDAAGLGPALSDFPAMEGTFSGFADQWGPELRYRTATLTEAQASELYADADEIYSWINENLVN